MNSTSHRPNLATTLCLVGLMATLINTQACLYDSGLEGATYQAPPEDMDDRRDQGEPDLGGEDLRTQDQSTDDTPPSPDAGPDVPDPPQDTGNQDTGNQDTGNQDMGTDSTDDTPDVPDVPPDDFCPPSISTENYSGLKNYYTFSSTAEQEGSNTLIEVEGVMRVCDLAPNRAHLMAPGANPGDERGLSLLGTPSLALPEDFSWDEDFTLVVQLQASGCGADCVLLDTSTQQDINWRLSQQANTLAWTLSRVSAPDALLRLEADLSGNSPHTVSLRYVQETSTLTLFVNGQAASHATLPLLLQRDETSRVYLGDANDNSGFPGALYHLQVWDRPLSDIEIYTLSHNQQPNTTRLPVLCSEPNTFLANDTDCIASGNPPQDQCPPGLDYFPLNDGEPPRQQCVIPGYCLTGWHSDGRGTCVSGDGCATDFSYRNGACVYQETGNKDPQDEKHCHDVTSDNQTPPTGIYTLKRDEDSRQVYCLFQGERKWTLAMRVHGRDATTPLTFGDRCWSDEDACSLNTLADPSKTGFDPLFYSEKTKRVLIQIEHPIGSGRIYTYELEHSRDEDEDLSELMTGDLHQFPIPSGMAPRWGNIFKGLGSPSNNNCDQLLAKPRDHLRFGFSGQGSSCLGDGVASWMAGAGFLAQGSGELNWIEQGRPSAGLLSVQAEAFSWRDAVISVYVSK